MRTAPLKRRPVRGTFFALTALVAMMMALVAAPALAAAPLAQTDAATAVTATTATLNGTVLPGKADTTYYFEYGTTTGYGTVTPTGAPVSGNAGKSVSADVTGLAPSTTYHFRITATNADGTSQGADATFTTTAAGATPPPPAGQNAITIAASAPGVTFGGSITITGQLSGPGNAGVQVTLEQNPAPYTGGFKPTALTATTTATGAYSLTVPPAVNTHYRVTAKTKPPVTSSEAAVNVRVKVTFHLSDRTPAKGQKVRFYGLVFPAHDGKIARIQRRTSTGHWRTVGSATLRPATPFNSVSRSNYSVRLRVKSNGTYRVKVAPGDGDHVAGISAHRSARVH